MRCNMKKTIIISFFFAVILCLNFCEASDARNPDEELLGEVQSLLSRVVQDQVMGIDKLDLMGPSKEKIAALADSVMPVGDQIYTILRSLALVKDDDLSIPLGFHLFGFVPYNTSIDSGAFSTPITKAQAKLMEWAQSNTFIPIYSLKDWAAVQFLTLFFDENIVSQLCFSVNLDRLKDINHIANIINGLVHASTSKIIGLDSRDDTQQIEVLQLLADAPQKDIRIVEAPDSAWKFITLVGSFLDPSVIATKERARISVELILDFQQQEFNDHDSIVAWSEALKDAFEDGSVNDIWNLKLQLIHPENLALGDLKPVLNSLIRSPIGVNLYLRDLIAEHPSSKHVVIKLVTELLDAGSQVRSLDFAGSQIPERGWESVAVLAESDKWFSRVSFAGMQIPETFVRRLGSLKAERIYMTGCGVRSDVLIEMVWGLLAEGSVLKGIDLRGNEVTEVIARAFLEKKFRVQRAQSGYLFAQ